MADSRFTVKCIAETIDGLRDGLTHFSGPSRAAIIYAIEAQDPIRIYDPQGLLRGHEPRFEELYLKSQAWRKSLSISGKKRYFSLILPEKNLELAGLVSYGGRSGSVFYQMFFSEHHPDMCAVGPTERWLEHAVWRLSHDIANEEELYTGISGSFLREYATHAVRDYLVDEMNRLLGWDTQIRVYPVLDIVLGISRTREEGAWPRGELVFVEAGQIGALDFVTSFPPQEQPSLENFKHVRKLLLAVENSRRKLVSDGQTILGIAAGDLSRFHIGADFRGTHGFLRLNGEAVCSFSDGRFKSTTHRAKLVQVEEALLETDLAPTESNALFKIIACIVHSAEERKHGCTIVVDLNAVPTPISGQKLDHPIDLRKPAYLELAKSLAKVDGALHVRADMHLHGFACLLDGLAVAGEDRSRGARFNSAIRFSAGNANILVIVVSSDRPVSIIQEGIEMSAQCQWKPVSSMITQPKTLSRWIAEGS